MTCEKVFAKNFYGMAYLLPILATFFQDSVKLFQDKFPRKNGFAIKSLIALWLQD